MQNKTGDRLIRYKRLSKDYLSHWGKKKPAQTHFYLISKLSIWGTQRGVVSISDIHFRNLVHPRQTNCLFTEEKSQQQLTIPFS